MTNSSHTFTVTLEDARGRPHKATYTRKARGSFPKMVKLERLQDNGKETFWTLYRPSCHGEIPNHFKAELNHAATLVRFQP